MNFDKMIEGLSLSDLMQLRDKCEIKLNHHACEHELAIREAIRNTYTNGFTIYFSKPNTDSEETFFIVDEDYHVEVEQRQYRYFNFILILAPGN